ncbi:hypothetical protein JMUB7513_27840 [Staphylococcus aureus]
MCIRDRHHLAYINPKKSDMTSITINGFFAKGGLYTGNVPTVKVYEYLRSDELPESVYANTNDQEKFKDVLLYTSPSPRDYAASRMPSSA